MSIDYPRFFARSGPHTLAAVAEAAGGTAPETGLLLLLGVDHFLDMGRSATNVIGNSIATAVVSKWEGELRTDSEVEAASQRAAGPA